MDSSPEPEVASRRPGAIARWWGSLPAPARTMLAVVVLSRLALLVWQLSVDPERLLYHDSGPYDALAARLVDDGTYAYPRWGPYSDLVRPPGYPLIVAANYAVFGRHPVAPVLWNLLGAVLTLAGAWALTRRMGLRSTLAAGLLFTLDLAWLLYSVKLMPEALFAPVLIAAVLLVLRADEPGKRAAPAGAAGLLVGAAALMKPIALYLPLVLVGYLAVRRRPAPALALALGFALAIAPWVGRNWVVHGTPAFTSLQNDNLLFAHAAFVWADVNDVTHQAAQEDLFDRLEVVIGHPLEGPEARIPPYAVLDAARGRLAREVLAAYPLTYARAIARGMAITLFDPGRLVFAHTFPQPDDPVIGFTQNVAREGVGGTVVRLLRDDPLTVGVLVPYLGFLALVFVLALLGLVPAVRAAPAPAALLILVAGYLLVLGGPHGYARFRLYVFPFELVFAAFGAAWLRGRIQPLISRRRRDSRPAVPSP